MMLQIKRLKCGYANKFHITDISFHVRKGGFTGIIGPNGSGKTTLFRGITSELNLDSGDVILDGRSVTKMDHKERARNMAIVTQEIEDAGIMVEDYVLMGRLPYRSTFQFFETKEDYRIAHKYLKLTDVFHLKDKYLYQLSGGEKQLAAIARALTQEPKLLLLDEPTSHLDITHQVQVLNLIQRLNSQLGLTVLMIIHDLNLAGEYCDHLIMMNNGRMHVTGKPEEVLTYKTIEDVYKTVVITKTNPLSKKPVVFLVSEKVLSENT
ncbi:MAG: ABC transporter ATP-binding protein [Bacteroidales bacterium]|nr:ABC transporter ATP-binding protein [Bacteroidales bacterium]